MCYQCQTNSVYEFTNKRKICRSCYIRWFEKKVFYSIRKFGMLEEGVIIGYMKKKDFRSVVLESVLKMISKNGAISLTSGKKFDKFAESLTTDLFVYDIIKKFIEGKINILNLGDKKNIFPLILFLDKEIELYARLKSLKFNRINKKDSNVSLFVNKLEEKHPEVKKSIINCFLKNISP
jgi:hypothetical protein